MIVLELESAGTLALAVAEVQLRPVLVQLPTMFALLAAPTSDGVARLDAVKDRPPARAGKRTRHYGTAIGMLRHFLAQVDAAELPPELQQAHHFDGLVGAFLRVRFTDRSFDSGTVCAGTHQALLLDGAHRALFRQMEESFLRLPADPLWSGTNYCAPLCTSANRSGDRGGPIVSLDKAVDFAERHGIGMVVASRPAGGAVGSPGECAILGIGRDRVTVHRTGPAIERLKARVPARLRSWPGAVEACLRAA